MKKYLLISILFLFVIGSLKSQVYRYIPDSAFRYVLRVTYSCPFDASGDSLDISSSAVTTSTTVIYCYSRSISSIEGIQYFTSLYTLNCRGNNITFISSLPPNLTQFICSENLLTTLPVLPSTLQNLACGNNELINLPPLPIGLYSLFCENNRLTDLILPPMLSRLSCGQIHFGILPPLPSTLEILMCNDDSLFSLPSPLPNLVYLDCGNNKFSSLPPLPASLKTLGCQNLNITVLPTLPPHLEDLFCFSDSLLTSIPDLPASLQQLDVSYIPNLTCLPRLPDSLTLIEYIGTRVSCIPNIVPRATYYPSLGTHPVCNPDSSSCPCYTSISGNVHQDINVDCTMDSLEFKLRNVNVRLMQGMTIVNMSSSNDNGLFAFDSAPFGDFTFDIDTTELPFEIFCPLAGSDTARLDTTHTIIANKHLGLICRTGFDLGTTGLITSSWIRPAATLAFDLHAGDFSMMHGAGCSSGTAMIVLDYTGDVIYSGEAPGTLVPDTILSNHLVWNISDVSILDFFNAIKPQFYIDSSAVAGDLICFTTEITPSGGDRVPSNNLFSQCFTVLTSYDPNVKEVSPSGTVTSSQGWLYYTVHFQNTGSSYAENVYIWDTIDSQLNLNTIQVMGSSDDVSMNVYPGNRSAKFSFKGINLPDSSSNEPFSHGYVQYRIKLNDSLSEGVNIHNTASILFDLNAPIITNTVTTSICNSPSQVSQFITIIEGNVINVGTHGYSRPGIYTDVLINSYGCDSIITTSLVVVVCDSTALTFTDTTIFLGQNLRVGLHTYATSGTYIDTFKSVVGCDSAIITTTLNVIDCTIPIIVSQSQTIDEGQQISVGTNIYTATGIYHDTLLSDVGCDSVVITTLQVLSGIEEVMTGKIRYYPNPANTKVIIELEGLPNSPLRMYDMYGRKVFDGEIISNKYVVNTESFIEGTYIIQCGLRHEKLVVKH